MKQRPDFEALDRHGIPCIRKARVIGELPSGQVAEALKEATQRLSLLVGIDAIATVKYGTPAFVALKGVTRNIAKQSPHAQMLLKRGDELPLDLCPSYERG